MTTSNHNIAIVLSFVGNQFDGQPVPPEGAELHEIVDAMAEIVEHQSSAEFEIFGRQVMRLVFERIKSNFAAEKTLRKFLQKGGNHAA